MLLAHNGYRAQRDGILGVILITLNLLPAQERHFLTPATAFTAFFRNSSSLGVESNY